MDDNRKLITVPEPDTDEWDEPDDEAWPHDTGFAFLVLIGGVFVICMVLTVIWKAWK